MKKLLILIFTCFVLSTVKAQLYEPQILILSPNEITYPNSFNDEINSINKKLNKNKKSNTLLGVEDSEMLKNQPENIQLISRSEVYYLKKMNFSKQISYQAFRYLTYRFYEKFSNLLILIAETKSSNNVDSLNSIAKLNGLQYVLNFSHIALYKSNGISYAKISVQLYDQKTQQFVINNDYVGDWNNPGFDFGCYEGTLECCINNALSNALHDVIGYIAANSPTIQFEQELAQRRLEVLKNNYLYQSYNSSFLDNVIPKSDTGIKLSNQYQLLLDSTNTKFVAFFIEQVDKQDFKLLRENKKDNDVRIISNLNITDEGFLDDVPQTYAYTIIGLKHADKWYYEKSNVTYFESKNLEEGKEKYFSNLSGWNFFNVKSADVNPEFWESYFFEKIEKSTIKNSQEISEIQSLLSNAKTSEDKQIYQSMLDDYVEEDSKNKDYFGLYRIVVKQLKLEKQKLFDQQNASITDEILPTFFSNYCKAKGINGIVKMNRTDFALIFPSDRSVYLVPIVLNFGEKKKELHYFVLIPNASDSFTIYKWNYFKPIKPEFDTMYGQEVNLQLNKITTWNFSFDTLDDTVFWKNYVLEKKDGQFKYLISINP